MCRYSSLLAGFALAVVCSAAQASTPAKVAISASSFKVLYGREVVIHGRLSQGIAAGANVVVTARPYGAAAPHPIAVIKTAGDRTWTYRVKPRIQTRYQARVRGVLSLPITLGVEPRVALTVLGNGRIRVEIKAGRSLAGRNVQLQRRTGAGLWHTVESTKLSSASIAVFPALLPTEAIRAALSVNEAGAGLLGATSHSLMYHEVRVMLQPPVVNPATYGVSTFLTGRLINGGAGQRVTIYAHHYGRAGVVKVATVKTGAHGNFIVPVVPAVLTTYQASFGEVTKGPAVTLGVRPELTLVENRDGSLTAHLKSGPVLRGRSVQLQRLGAGGWKTIAKLALSNRLTAQFRVNLARARVRVALSVNQAGAGYLGTTSASLLYRSR